MSYPAAFLAWWPEDGENREDAVALEMHPGWLQSERAHQYAAEQAGEYDHDCRDGWERQGDTQTIVVLAVDDQGGAIGDPQRFAVLRETVPQFHAARIKQEGGAS